MTENKKPIASYGSATFNKILNFWDVLSLELVNKYVCVCVCVCVYIYIYIFSNTLKTNDTQTIN